MELSLISLTFSGNPGLPTGFEGCRSHDVVLSLRVDTAAIGRRDGLSVRIREVEPERIGGVRGGGRGFADPSAPECRAQLQDGISAGSVSSALIGLALLIPPDVWH